MRTLKWTAGAVAICVGATVFAVSTTAASAANVNDCVRSGKEVRTALASNQDSPKSQDARKQQRYGLQYCNQGLYRQGLAHYAEALRLLGAGGKS